MDGLPEICLTMIVKNESKVIRRCLESAMPLCSTWVIVDTGSTDGTQELIRETLKDVPGELHERPWRNFGHNRTEAMRLARGKADYLLILDADEELASAEGFRMPPLTHDRYLIRTFYGGITYYRTQLVRGSRDWRYEGVLHEYITCDEPCTEAKLEGLAVISHPDGARSSDPDKYRKDAAVLEEALRAEPENARYAFYFAQSLRDAGEPARALEAYEKRRAMGGWEEEVWYSMLQIAKLREHLGGPREAVCAAYLSAFQFRPNRAEPLCDLARLHRGWGEHALAYLYAHQAARMPRPDDLLFIDDAVYAWRSLDEWAISAYYVGRHSEAIKANWTLLSGGLLPPTEADRVRRNLAFSMEKIGPDAFTASL